MTTAGRLQALAETSSFDLAREVLCLRAGRQELLEALQELLAVNADPAPGWNPDLLLDKEAFRQFLDVCDGRKRAAEDRARAAIATATSYPA